MKPEDFPPFVFEGKCYRVVPELPEPHLDSRCEGCAACPVGGQLDRELCRRMYRYAQALGPDMDCSVDTDVGVAGSLYVPEDQFDDYVVELVRRRISS